MRIIGLGRAVPQLTVANADFARIADTGDAWIRTRTGIRERHFTGRYLPDALRAAAQERAGQEAERRAAEEAAQVCTPTETDGTDPKPAEETGTLTNNGASCGTDPKPAEETDCTLAVRAAKNALSDAGLDPASIGLVITATSTMEQRMPSLACRVRAEAGLPEGIPAFDVNAACTGFIYALRVADALMRTGTGGPALVIGAEEVSSVLDFSDRSTMVLFGDAAAAAVLTVEGPFAAHLSSGGDPGLLYIDRQYHLRMRGREVFRYAVGAIAREMIALEAQTGISAREVDYIVCHQANRRIIDHVRKAADLPEEKFFLNLDRYGNTSAASIPSALAEMKERGMLTPGTQVFAVGFGAGMTSGSAYLKF